MEELHNDANVTPDVTTATPSVDTAKVEAPFREFKTQKDFDDFSAYLMRKGEEKALKGIKVTEGENTFDYKEYEKKYRKDLETQIIAEYERKAKMTAEERAAELAREREQQFKDREIALNQREAQVLLSEAGFDEEEMEVYLDFVTEDREASLGKIRRVCDSQKAKLAKQKQAILDELQAKAPNMQFDSGNVNALQTRYDKAKAEGNLMMMSSLLREAQSKGITLRN